MKYQIHQKHVLEGARKVKRRRTSINKATKQLLKPVLQMYLFSMDQSNLMNGGHRGEGVEIQRSAQISAKTRRSGILNKIPRPCDTKD